MRVSQSEQGGESEAERAVRKRTAAHRYDDSVPFEHVEAKRRAILAANEFLAGGKGTQGLGVSDLCRKYGVPNRGTVYREVAYIEQNAEMMEGISILRESAPAILTQAAQDSGPGSDSDSCSGPDCESMTAQQQYGAAMAMATLAVHKKTKKLEEACRMAEAKFPGVHLNRHTVRKYARTQPGQVPLPAGRQPIIPPYH